MPLYRMIPCGDTVALLTPEDGESPSMQMVPYEKYARLEAQNKALEDALEETRKWLPLLEDRVPYRRGRKCANLKDVHAKIDAAIAQAKEQTDGK